MQEFPGLRVRSSEIMHGYQQSELGNQRALHIGWPQLTHSIVIPGGSPTSDSVSSGSYQMAPPIGIYMLKAIFHLGFYQSQEKCSEPSG